MSRLIRTVAVVSTGALLVMLTPAFAAAKTVSNGQYAETYCDAIETALDDLDELQNNGFSARDATSLRTGALADADSLVASLQGAAEDLKRLTPQDGGKKVAALFDTTLAQQVSGIQTARGVFAAADPSAPTFTRAADALVLAAGAALNTFDAPFAELGKYGALRKAMTKSCNIVRTG